MKTVIITDSTCDLSQQQAKQLSIEIVPLTLTFDTHSYLDGIDITKAEFFQLQSQNEGMARTSQPSPEDFFKLFEKHKIMGESVVYIGISSFLSGTMQSANIAKDMLGYEEIYIVDTLSASFGVEACVRMACSLRDAGVSGKEIARAVEEKKNKLKIFAEVDTLKYLVRGGRISKAAGFLGGALGLKPIITISEGQLISCGKVRGQQAAFEQLSKIIKEHDIDETLPIILTHAADNKSMMIFADFLRQSGVDYNWLYSEVGSVIGTHTG
ncbi:MAG: DegV family protein, partial [Oscillospiraceae bacterium]